MSGAARRVLRRPGGDLRDGVLLCLLLAGLYALFTLVSLVLGYDFNGWLNTLREITFLSAVYAMLSLALNLQWGYTGLFNIGVAGFMAVGVYTMAMLSGAPSGSPPGFGLPLPLGILGGILAAATIGVVTALPALRLRGDYLAIVTLAISEIIRITYQSPFFEDAIPPVSLGPITLGPVAVGTGASQGINLPTNPIRSLFYVQPSQAGSETTALGSALFEFFDVLGIQPTVVVWTVWVVVLMAFLGGFYWLLRRIGNSPFGRVLKAIREDEQVASALGKDPRLFKAKVFALGCGLMGLAAMLWFLNPVGFTGYVSPSTFRPIQTFYVFVAVIIGGAGSTTGSIVGGAVFAALLLQGPLYVRRIVNALFEFGRSPDTIFGAVGPLGQFDVGPFLAYATEDVNISALRLVLLGVVLVYLIQRRPNGLLGHRTGVASPIDLSDRSGGED